jgi:hypothetical protein
VHPVDRGQHRRDQDRRGEGRREPGREQCPAARLGPAGHDRVAPARAQAELLEALRRRVEALAAEPAKQLLRPVPHEQSAHHQPQQQSSDLHRYQLS